jgi:predicted permease
MYGILLTLLAPASFRNEYGTEMKAVAAKRLREASWLAAPWVWLDVIADLVLASIASHWDLFLQDVHYALRSASKAKSFTLVVIGVAALGVAAATSVFTVANHVLLNPLPYSEPDRLVKLWENHTSRGYPKVDVSPANFHDWQQMSTSFEAIAAFSDRPVNMTGSGEPERVVGAAITHELFPILRISPIFGRSFTAADDKEGAPKTVMISYSLWQDRFGGDPAIAGKSLDLDGEPATIIGVMPSDFFFPRREVRIWTTLRFGPQDFQDRENLMLRVAGRLKRGVTLEQAQAELQVIGSRLAAQYPKTNRNISVTSVRMQDEFPARSRTIVTILGTAAGFLLLIACSNLANLILARSAARRKEIEVRAALGAGRERLIRQLLTESALLASIGGILGIGLAYLAIPSLSLLVPSTMPVSAVPRIDWHVLLFALGVTVVTGIAFGTLPALRSSASALSIRSGTSTPKDRVRRVLVVVQVAASIALVLCTGLLIRALNKLQNVNPGFAVDQMLAFRTALPFPKYMQTAKRQNYYDSVLNNIRTLPGVRAASVTSFRPMGDFRGGIWPVRLPGEVRDYHICSRFLAPGYFDTMRIPILRGRDFLPSDGPQSQLVAIVSESFVKEHWAGETAVGRSFENRIDNRTYTVIGVAGDVKFRGIEGSSEPQVYLAASQMQDRWFVWFTPKDFVVSTAPTVDPITLMPAIRRIVAQADPLQPISDVQTFQDLIDAETAARRVQLWVIAAFAIAAFVLAGVGIHGLLSFAVAQRTQEIGLRRALGAGTGSIASLVLNEALLLGVVGSVVGLLAAYGLARSMEALLAGVPPTDLATIGASIGAAILMTLLGTMLPTIRAMRVDPAIALRTE